MPAEWSPVTTVEDLVEIVGEPLAYVASKERDRLHELDRDWLAASPFCVLSTSASDGTCDASPKGDPAGELVHVIDDRTIAIAERPGNKRVDGYRNVLSNPHVGLVFVIPGRGDTLRVNGRATIVRDAPFFDDMTVKGRRPVLALVVEVEQVFHHCAKAFLRSRLWESQTWDPQALPSVARISKAVYRPDEELAAIQQHYGPDYAERLY